MTHLLRLAAGLVAAGVAIALLSPSPPSDPVRRALDEVASGDRHFRLAEEARTLDLFSRADALRFEETPERYTLVDGQAGFAVDEDANRFTRLAAAERDRLRGNGWDVRASAVVGSSPRDGGTMYTLDPPAEVDLDASGKFVELRRYAAGKLVATLTLLGNAPPAADDKFALKNTLSEDGRVGKVTDVQGLASIKPVGATRFTPLRPNTLVMPGDYLRVDARGANAVTVRLLPEATVVVGPGGLVEVAKPTKLRLLQGECEVSPTKGTPVELRGPGDTALTLAERGFYRLAGDKLARVPADPVWLKSLKGASVGESLGSLVAQVDGRAVSLSVGVHKVNVEVRDQIARTTIEETFVNHTNSQLEGVFHFPLPQDASIAGFAMWIGDEKVEADVVEKQRAREIFETILREKRDPGLLEWAGGNLFKARVFPIFAHSEKRISITYTQVLPAVGNAVRYSYALQSEMLRVNPLKELSVTFSVNSALPLKAVTSPTHPCRAAFAGTSAKLEFVAQNYTPTADFEAVIELADAAPAVTLIPHRRGSDGYFLLQVTPPAPPQSGRELVSSDVPLSLLLWCDTSASIDAGQRRNQAALAGALLTALTPKDTFNLAVTDVTTLFAFAGPTPATPENVNAARDFLAKRASLGWSNLEGGLTAVLAQSPPGTHVVYLGDGVAGTVVADPQAAAVRLEEAYKLAAKPVTVHAVALGSSFESGVMAKLASLGGGSSRRVSGDQSPTKVALDILGEVTRPPVRNVKVAFTGLKTAKVYPEVLPNLTPGTQQILLGRYLPEGTDQKGEAVVTGTQAGREVRFAAAVTLKDAEAGNSFLPRLWARLHLDKLLEGPQSPATKDDVIGLSEEFHIMTPYTSFLVLESDADRARFSVKRRFEMRDGEQFFADGKKAATYALAREQMKLAGLWRAGLRRNVLNRLANLDRPAQVSHPEGHEPEDSRAGGKYQLSLGRMRKVSDTEFALTAPAAPKPASAQGGPVDGMRAWELKGNRSELGEEELLAKSFDGGGGERFAQELGEVKLGLDALADGPGEPQARPSLARKLRAVDRVIPPSYDDYDDFGEAELEFRGRGASPHFDKRKSAIVRGSDRYRFGVNPIPSPRPIEVSPLDALFPNVPPVPGDAPVKSPWAKDVTDLATLVYRRPTLAALPGGLTIERTTQYVRPRLVSSEHRETEFYSPKRWAIRHGYDVYATQLDWCDGVSRFTLNTAFNLARRRDAQPADLTHPRVNSFDATMIPLWQQYPGVAKLEAGNIIVTTSADGKHVVRVTIDPAKKVVTRTESRYEGALGVTVTTYGGFVQARGQWWATVIETVTGDKVQILTTQTVTETDDASITKAFDALTAPLAKCVVQCLPYPKLADAKAALAAGKATTDDRFALLRQALNYQRFEEATAELDAIDKLEAGKPALTWLRITLQMASRRNEEARQRMLAAVPEVLALPTTGDRIAMAQWLTQQASSILSYPEQRELRDKFAALFNALPLTHGTRRDWATQSYYGLTNAGLGVEAFAYLKALVAADPTNFSQRVLYLQLLFGRGDRDAATAGLREQLAAKDAWDKSEVAQLYAILAEFQEREGNLAAKLDTLTAWLDSAPADENAAWQLLSALVRTDAAAKADALVSQWLAEAKVAVPTAAQVAKARAAVRHVAGQADRLPSDRIDPKWVAVLADAARYFFAQEKSSGLAVVILNNTLFQQTDAGPKLVAELFERVLEGVAGRSLPRLNDDMVWLSNVNSVGRDRWVKLADAVKARWAGVADDDAKFVLGQQLAQVLRGRVGFEDALAFTRERLKSGPAKYRRREFDALLHELQQAPWSEARVNEAFDILPEFLTDTDGKPTPADAVSRLMQLADWSLRTRDAQLQVELKNPERLTRPALKAARTEATRQARGELIDRLTKREATYPAPLKAWAKLERLTFQAKHDADPNAVAAELFALLGDAPLAVPAEDADAEVTPAQVLASEFEARAVGLALHAATRRAAKPETVARLQKFLDAGVAAQPKADGWKRAKYDLLVALDSPKELEASLTAWAKAGDPTAQWRTALGYLLAELGRLKEAIAVFEGIAEIDAAAYGRAMALSRLYMAIDDQAKHDAARAAAYRALSEQQLSQLLQAKFSRWQPRQGVTLPTELDADTLPILAALVEKATSVDSYFYATQGLYRASKDFRIPATLANAALGHTPGLAYAVVSRMQPLLNDIRDEASADTLFARIEALRPKAKSPTDLRALDLIAMQIHRRAAEVRNQPGPHAELALAAFRRAFDRQWADGEKLLMARLLRDFGTVTPETLAAEQLRQLKALHDGATRGTPEHLQIAEHYAATLNGYAKSVEAIGVLTPAVAQYVAANKGAFPSEAVPPANLLASMVEAKQGHAAAEKLWLGWRDAAANAQLRLTIGSQLDALYFRAFESGNAVSLGTGEPLYVALLGRLNARLRNPDPNEQSQALSGFAPLLRVAGAKVYVRTGADVLRLANETFPALIKPWDQSYASHVQAVAQLVHDHAGFVNAWAFQLDRVEAVPAWLRHANRGGWGLGHWRYNGDYGVPRTLPEALQARLLKIALADLTEDLRSRRQHNRELSDARYGYYWSAKEAEFVAAAEAVLAEAKDSVPTQLFVAEYLFRGCNRAGRAIDVLFALHRAKRLDPAGRATLTVYLVQVTRYAEAVELLVPLIDESPDDTATRFRLMTAYTRLGKPAELRELFARSVARWRERNAWNTGTMPGFADIAQNCDLHAEAVAVYAELIPNAQRQSGSPNRDLAEYYRRYAVSLSKVGKWVEAVDAASGAVVAWGADLNSRQSALVALNATVAQAGNLDALVTHFDQETAKTGLVNPILRKALGAAYAARQNYGPAIVQYELAVAAQPNDPETFTALIACYDAMNRKPEAVARILESLDLSRRDLPRIANLGHRYAAAGDQANAERAFTSLVEVTRGETEGQTLLAQIRQSQDRWAEALPHWQQVDAVRSLEPAGLIGLAEAQLHLKQFDAAKATLQKLRAKAWPPHTGDTPAKVRELEAKLPK